MFDLQSKMKIFHTSAIIIIALLTVFSNTQITQTNYLTNLPVSPTLLASTNTAINTLYTFLQKYFYCPVSPPVATQPPQTCNSNSGFGGMGFLGSTLGFGGSKVSGSSQPIYGCSWSHIQHLTPQLSSFQSIGMFPFNLKYQLYQNILNLSNLLLKIKNQIKQYNNIIIGNGSTVVGSGNVVIGNNDTITGNNNWIFASDYSSTTPEDGQLVIQDYIIQLSNMCQVAKNPFSVVSCVNSDDAKTAYHSWWDNAAPTQRMCFFS